MNPNNCPNEAKILQLCAGTLPEYESDVVIAHVDDCVRCQQVMEQDTVEDTLVADLPSLRNIAVPSPLLLETIARVKTESGTSRIVEGFDDVLPWLEPSDEGLGERGLGERGLGERGLGERGLGELGHYTILDCVGRGGMGVVFRARDNSLHRDVAIKVLAPSYAMNASAKKRFIREAHAVARVQHPNVVAIYAVDEDAKIPFFAMELVKGPNLQDLLEQRGSLSVDETVKLGIQIAEGLDAAHKQQIIHRDVKPANVLLSADTKTAKVSDFGLAYIADQTALTRSGIIVGTPAFVAPENIDESSTPDHRSDLFSFGSVLYRMIAGEVPFRGSSTLATLHKISTTTPPPLSDHALDTPAWLVAIVERLHAKSPDERFASAADVAKCLRAGAAGKTVELPRPSLPTTKTSTWQNFAVGSKLRNSLLAMAVALVIVYTAWLIADNYIFNGAPLPASNGHREENDHDKHEHEDDDHDRHERDEHEDDEDEHDHDHEKDD